MINNPSENDNEWLTNKLKKNLNKDKEKEQLLIDKLLIISNKITFCLWIFVLGVYVFLLFWWGLEYFNVLLPWFIFITVWIGINRIIKLMLKKYGLIKVERKQKDAL